VTLEKMIRMILQVTENTLGVYNSANNYLLLLYVLSSKEVLRLKAVKRKKRERKKNAS